MVQTAWTAHIRQFAMENNLSYMCAAGDPRAKASYVRPINPDRPERKRPERPIRPRAERKRAQPRAERKRVEIKIAPPRARTPEPQPPIIDLTRPKVDRNEIKHLINLHRLYEKQANDAILGLPSLYQENDMADIMDEKKLIENMDYYLELYNNKRSYYKPILNEKQKKKLNYIKKLYNDNRTELILKTGKWYPSMKSLIKPYTTQQKRPAPIIADNYRGGELGYGNYNRVAYKPNNAYENMYNHAMERKRLLTI